MNRLLALPAVLCLVLGVLLGVWGWGERDTTRARIVAEVDDPTTFGPADEEASIFGPASGDQEEQTEAVCTLLLDASQLRGPLNGFAPGAPEPVPGEPAASSVPAVSPLEEAAAIVGVLDPQIVTGLPRLAEPDVVIAIDRQREAMQRILLDGRDPSTDPEVLAAASQLEAALHGVC
ncbi:hypothetical protein [Iamia sp.]|uniref:hypothetical protein n=1 Tax=Iamia sp. TaxID=2722710 RepID=UPI002B5FB0D1|nr:hypothetical protein [Iamia sp.]HXH55922.1 hypothetical protein [Iamia sp.]